MRLPCQIRGCSGTHNDGLLMCLRCWRGLPRALQRDINRSWAEANDSSATREQRAMAMTTYRGARDAALAAAEEKLR